MRRGLALLLLLVPLAAGCGSDPASLDGSNDALEDAGSSRVEMTISGGRPDWSYSGEGSMDYVHSRGNFVLTGKSPNDEFHLIFDGRNAYSGVKLLGKMRWQKESDYKATGTDRFMPGPGAASPDQVLALLTKLSTKVEKAGVEQVRGVSTTRYRAHLDPKKLGDEEPMVDGDVVADAWVDDHGLVRRLRVPLGSKDEPVSVLEFFDFGTDVDVHVPPADELVSEEEFSTLFDKECRLERGEKREVSQLCVDLMGDSGTSSDSTETMPRRVSDSK
jgi:hypothetical protein